MLEMILIPYQHTVLTSNDFDHLAFLAFVFACDDFDQIVLLDVIFGLESALVLWFTALQVLLKQSS